MSTVANQTYYWIYGTYQGRAFRAGKYNTREQASSEGIRLCGADFEIFELPTKSTTDAGRMIKHILATRASNIGEGFKKHDLRDGNDSQEKDERW